MYIVYTNATPTLTTADPMASVTLIGSETPQLAGKNYQAFFLTMSIIHPQKRIFCCKKIPVTSNIKTSQQKCIMSNTCIKL